MANPVRDRWWVLFTACCIQPLCLACTDDPYPGHIVRLTTPAGVATRTVDSNHTFAWGASQLAPAVPSTGSAAYGGKLEFLAPTNAAQFVRSPKQQEVMAFDLGWNLGQYGFLQAQRPIVLDVGRAYNTVIGHGSIQLKEPPGYGAGFPPLHVVRYWHGECSIRLGWTQGDLALFPLLDKAMAQAVSCAAKYPVQVDPECVTNDETYAPCPLVPNLPIPEWIQDLGSTKMTVKSAEYSPQFSSEADVNRMGFFFLNSYSVKWSLAGGIPLIDFSLKLNPTYEVGLSGDGFVRVGQIGPNYVVMVPNKPEVVQDIIQPALATLLPRRMEEVFRQNLTVPLNLVASAAPPILQPVFLDAIACDPGLPTAEQQTGCYQQVVGTTTPLANSLLFQFVRGQILQYLNSIPYPSNPEAYATFEAAKFVLALQPRNFSCSPNPDGAGFCAFRPIIHRVNVLPNELELVVARDLDFGGAEAENEVALYTWLPVLMYNAGVDFPAELTSFCGGPTRPARGVFSRLQQFNQALPDPPTCSSCFPGDEYVCSQF